MVSFKCIALAAIAIPALAATTPEQALEEAIENIQEEALENIQGSPLSTSSGSPSGISLSSGDNTVNSIFEALGGLLPSSASGSTSTPTSSTSLPSSTSGAVGSMSSGSPSGISLSSGDDTLESILEFLRNLLPGGSSLGGGSTSLPAKRALAVQA